jgi:hypothetical protein
MYKYRATIFLGAGESSTCFFDCDTKPIEKTQKYSVFCPRNNLTKICYGAELVNPEILFEVYTYLPEYQI